MSPPRLISGFRELADNYNAILCDVWGVLHNGRDPFAGADAALVRFRDAGGKVLLLSNAPRPGATVTARLDEIGVARAAYDDILTSGDVARALLMERGQQNQTCHHIGPAKDADLLAGIDIRFADIDAADFILLSGLNDDNVETPEDYLSAMQTWHARNLQLVCANPDRQVQFGDRVIYCAGAVAEIYEQNGGDVVWLGKPYQPVYERARAQLNDMLDTPARILAIGDGPKTDIPGAQAADIDALFITGGLAGAVQNLDTPDQIDAVLQAENTSALAAMRHLVW
jgi:HAD superfamily hydrolase (TIGR01459 family)